MAERTETLTVSLFKREVTSLEMCLEGEKRAGLTRIELPPAVGEGAVFFPDAARRKPGWVSFLEGGLGREVDLLVGSAAAVLLLKRPDGIVACTWGSGGRFLLDRELLVEDFGLKVALNTVDPERIRSTDSKTIDESSMHTRNQSSRQTSFDQFEFDANRAILQAVTGQPRDAGFGKSITGGESLKITTQLEFSGLSAKTDELLRHYRAKTYKKSFPWLDSLKSVKDEAKVRELEALLLEKFMSQDLDNCHLAPPELLDWDLIEGFVYPGRRAKDLETELSLGNCLYHLAKGDMSNMDPAKLRSAKIRLKRVDGEGLLPAWTVHKALVAQVEMGGKSYILSGGKWFEVEGDYVKRVDHDLAHIPLSTLSFPDAQPGWTEGKYNEEAVKANKDWMLADRKNLKPPGAISPIEVCDILTTKGEFIHVKKRKSSATLSHLFSQGMVSAQVMRGDAGFRDAVKSLAVRINRIAAAQIPWDAIEAGKLSVVYAIIAEEGKPIPQGLPFFAKVNLSHALRVLKPLQCDVELGRIGEAKIP